MSAIGTSKCSAGRPARQRRHMVRSAASSPRATLALCRQGEFNQRSRMPSRRTPSASMSCARSTAIRTNPAASSQLPSHRAPSGKARQRSGSARARGRAASPPARPKAWLVVVPPVYGQASRWYRQAPHHSDPPPCASGARVDLAPLFAVSNLQRQRRESSRRGYVRSRFRVPRLSRP